MFSTLCCRDQWEDLKIAVFIDDISDDISFFVPQQHISTIKAISAKNSRDRTYETCQTLFVIDK